VYYTAKYLIEHNIVYVFVSLTTLTFYDKH